MRMGAKTTNVSNSWATRCCSCAPRHLLVRPLCPRLAKGQLSRLAVAHRQHPCLGRARSAALGIGEAHCALASAKRRPEAGTDPDCSRGSTEAVLGCHLCRRRVRRRRTGRGHQRWLEPSLQSLIGKPRGLAPGKMPRSRLQERVQQRFVARGSELRVWPEPHRSGSSIPTFVVEVRLGDEVLGHGPGFDSKREASTPCR